MSSFNPPNVLKNLIPYDENGGKVAVLYGYDPVTQKYFPLSADPTTGILNVSGGGSSGESLELIGDFTIMHNAITSADTTIPSAPLALFNMEGYKKMVVDIKMDPGSEVTLLPLAWNEVTGIYQTGKSKSFTSDDPNRSFVVVSGADDVYLLPIAVVGTVTVAVAGCN